MTQLPLYAVCRKANLTLGPYSHRGLIGMTTFSTNTTPISFDVISGSLESKLE